MSSKLKFLSINKQYRRLFNGPIDPTMTWDNLDELGIYLDSPTSYPNQIVGCEGKAYIIVLENGKKKLLEIGLTGSGGDGGGNVEIPDNIMDLINDKADKIHKHKIADIDGLIDSGGSISLAGYHVGPEPPTEEMYGPNFTKLLWIDTSDKGIDNTLDSVILNEMKAIISNLNKEVEKLRQEVEDLKNNTSPPSNDFDILMEDGSIIITEDGHTLTLEQKINELFDILMENGDSILTEDGYNLTLEQINELFDILMENGDSILTEDGYVLSLENVVDLFNILMENDNSILTENDINVVLEEYKELLNTNNILTEEDDILIEKISSCYNKNI